MGRKVHQIGDTRGRGGRERREREREREGGRKGGREGERERER